jgi:small GTP-binding protein
MLRQIIVLKGKQTIFKHEYGRTLSWEALSPIINSLIDFISAEKRDEDIIDFMNIVNYRLAYFYSVKFEILIIFITDLTDKQDDIKANLNTFYSGFVQSYTEYLQQGIIDPESYADTKYICDEIFKELRPKIALIGFSGVGKTTITKLIRAEDIPMKHVPTITGDVAAIKVGDLPMFCWDFAGQEQFSFIWSRFVKGSDAIILVVDSTKQNLRESKFFVDLIKKEAPKTRVAIVANKQDLPGALSPEDIANNLGYRTYPLIAIDPQQRSVMVNIIAEVVEVTSGTTALIQPMLERDRLMEEAESAIMQGNILKASETYKRIGDLSSQLGEDSLSEYFYGQSKVLAQQLQSVAQKMMEKKPIDSTGTSEIRSRVEMNYPTPSQGNEQKPQIPSQEPPRQVTYNPPVNEPAPQAQEPQIPNPPQQTQNPPEAPTHQQPITEHPSIPTQEPPQNQEVDEKARIAQLEEELKNINNSIDQMKANISNMDEMEFKKQMMEHEDRKNKIHREIMDLRMEIIKKLTV